MSPHTAPPTSLQKRAPAKSSNEISALSALRVTVKKATLKRSTALSTRLSTVQDDHQQDSEPVRRAEKTAAERDRYKAGLAPDLGRDQHDKQYTYGARGPPVPRLLDKHQVLAITGVSYTTLWHWMIDGRFPKPRVVGGHAKSKSVWRSDEIAAWLDALPQRQLKAPVEAVIDRCR